MFSFLKSLLELFMRVLNAVLPLIEASNKRLSDAVANDEAVRKKALLDQINRETANLKAFDQIIDESWKIRYNQIVTFIKNDQYDQVLILCEFDKYDIEDILFDTTKSPEYRAMKLVLLMKGNSNKDSENAKNIYSDSLQKES